MARIDDIFKKEIRHADPQRKRKGKFRWVHYTKLHRNKDQYCDPTLDEIERLADLIDAEGEILQDLVIKKDGPDDYEIMAGHKRHLACKLLVENRGKKEYEFLPCYEINDSEVRSEFRVYSTNGYHEKTDYEKMHEIERMRALLIEHPEEFPNVQGGRMVERLAQVTAMKKTTVGEYLTISKNLGDKGMEMFKKGELKKSAAVALSGLSKDEQNKVIDQGITTHTDIKRLKKKIEKQEELKPEEQVKQLKKPDGVTEHEQPELPHFKNNDQRKEWLRNYKAWGIWYKDENIGCTYYKYDFSNGACLIAETYCMPATSWYDAHEAYYLHLVGGPEAPQRGNGCGRKWQSHKVYTRHPDNETDLVEFLKYVQKG